MSVKNGENGGRSLDVAGFWSSAAPSSEASRMVSGTQLCLLLLALSGGSLLVGGGGDGVGEGIMSSLGLKWLPWGMIVTCRVLCAIRASLAGDNDKPARDCALKALMKTSLARCRLEAAVADLPRHELLTQYDLPSFAIARYLRNMRWSTWWSASIPIR
jgi:hypothetical protein